nr:hypothetical protein [Tanacetum cinerariifolium]
MQEMQYSKQLNFNNNLDFDLKSDSNMISYELYLKETENTVVQGTSSSTQNDATIMYVIEEMSNQVSKCNEGRQNQGYAGSGARSNAIGVNRIRGTNTAGQVKVIRCYNCQEEGHMARQYTKPKRPRNLSWFKEKAMLVEALESRMVLDEEHMASIADNGDTFTSSQQSQEIPTPVIFQIDDLDAFDSKCNEAPSASV